MEPGLNGKVATVAGGSKGTGRAIALGLLAEGDSALIVARGAESLAAGPDGLEGSHSFLNHSAARASVG